MPQRKAATQQKRLNVVTIGGGTGHFALLSGIKKYNVHIAAVVTMADDGGSTGVLRDELGVLPPGDLRQCLVALSEGDELMRRLFTHRFSKGTLKGHTFGNIFLSTLEHVTGSINEAIDEVGRILKITGRVLPVTLDTAKLVLELKNGKVLRGEHVIDEYAHLTRFGVHKAYLTPRPVLNPDVRTAVHEADIIVFGPGDLYTSLLPNILVPGLARVLKRSKAKKVFVSNLMNAYGQTDNFTCMDYVDEFERLCGVKFLDHILYNTMEIPAPLLKRYVDEGEPVVCGAETRKGITCTGTALLSKTIEKPKKGDSVRRTLIRHDPDMLAQALVKLAVQ